jgi:hypothetical protein
MCCPWWQCHDRYLHVLQEEFLPFIQGMGVNFGETFFQQEGARPHTANAVLDVLSENFDEKSVVYSFS